MTTVKNKLHVRNRHRSGYNFALLIKNVPELKPYVITTAYQKLSIDFSNPEAVKLLNKALLVSYYNVKNWDLPVGYLCPAIPGRVDYIHYLADLLNESGQGLVINQHKVHVLDIGTGASCIYPLLGAYEYHWQFIASDIDPISIKAADSLIESNQPLNQYISCRLQKNAKHIFHQMIEADEYFALTMCNPPFHSSLKEATKGSVQKWKNLKNTKKSDKTLNFGGQKAELWCDGGEVKFIQTMVHESKFYRSQVLWFTCLVSKNDSLRAIKLALKKAKVQQVKIVKMAQGQKVSRFICWSFFDHETQKQWCKERL